MARGAESGVHAVREYILSHNDATTDRAIVKIDMKNAFNTVHRRVVLQEIYQRFPEIYSISYLSYGSDTPLYYGIHWCSAGEPSGISCFRLSHRQRRQGSED